MNVNGKEIQTLQHVAVVFPLLNNSLKNLKLINRCKEIDDVYDAPITSFLIEYYWERSKGYLWGLLIYHLLPLGLLTAFAVVNDRSLANILLIPLITTSCLYLINEGAELSSHPISHLKNAWNWVDILFILVHLIMASLFWSNTSESLERLFISFALFFSYTKLLTLMRVIDQLRYLIRMIVEIIKDSVSFMAVAGIYVLAFALIFYQSRLNSTLEAVFEERSFGNELLETYTLLLGDWDLDFYTPTTMPFFVMVTLILTLIMLNMVIAIMADTFTRVQENSKVVNYKERLTMTTEALSVHDKISWLTSMITSIWCCKRDPKPAQGTSYKKVVDYTDSNKKNSTKRISQKKNHSFLLVIEPYEQEEENKKEKQAGANGANEKITILEQQIGGLDGKIESLTTKLDSLNHKVDELLELSR